VDEELWKRMPGWVLILREVYLEQIKEEQGNKVENKKKPIVETRISKSEDGI